MEFLPEIIVTNNKLVDTEAKKVTYVKYAGTIICSMKCDELD